MSEANAEDGLHGLDEPLAIINDTRLNIEFAFDSDCFFLRRSPTEPRFRPFNFKKIPLRKRKSMERRNGARAERRVPACAEASAGRREALVGL